MSKIVCEMRGDVFEHETIMCEMRGNNFEHKMSMCEMSMCERRYSGEMRDDETTRTISRFNLFLFGLFPFPSDLEIATDAIKIANRKSQNLKYANRNPNSQNHASSHVENRKRHETASGHRTAPSTTTADTDAGASAGAGAGDDGACDGESISPFRYG